MLAKEFWKLKSTYLNVSEIEEHESTYLGYIFSDVQEKVMTPRL